MRWPHREDWSAHLVRYIDGHSSLEPRPGPHGGYVNDRGYEHVACPTCGNVAIWPPDPPATMYCFPPGHRIDRDAGGFPVGNTCPGAER